MIARILRTLAARRLSKHAKQVERERIRAKTREMRRDLGLPPLKALGR